MNTRVESRSPNSSRAQRVPVQRLRGALARALAGLCALAPFAHAQATGGTWTKLEHNPPGAVNLMLLLSDGSIMAARNDGSSIGKGWYKLTPDAHGSYVQGTWTTLASMNYTRLYYPSQVLRDGRVFVAGGEYGTGGPHAEIYDPLTDVWTVVDPPASLWNVASDNFYDCNSELTPDGRVLLMPVFPHSSATPLLYNPATNSWANAGKLAHGTYQDEASWVKLPDDSVLTIDPFGTQSERYLPASNTWVADGNVPVSLYDPFGFELGGAVLLPNGKAFFLGSTGKTALYTPTGSASPGVWTAGPDIPANKGTPDAPAAMLVGGNVLCAVSPVPTAGNHFPSPTSFYEYDPVANSFFAVGAPNGATDNTPTYTTAMLALPNGKVLYSHFGLDVYMYRPSTVPLSAGRPVIQSITANPDGSFHLVGTGLNGLSEGATYGDDLQMNSNYPIVRLNALPDVYYARSYNWSSTGVQTGAKIVSTEFRVPASVPSGSYSLEVVANGIASLPVNFTLPFGGAWSAIGAPLAGAAGMPSLSASGVLSAGGSTSFHLAQGLASAIGAHVFGTSALNLPLFGGVLVPDTFKLVAFSLSPAGTTDLAMPWPANLPSGLQIYAQSWILDPAGVQGFAASNAVTATAP